MNTAISLEAELDLDLFNSIPIPCFILEPSSNRDLIYVAFNDEAIKFANIDPVKFVGRNARQMYHGEYGEYAYKIQLEAYRTAQVTTYELALPINGKLHHIRTQLTPFFGSDGKLLRFLGAGVDITAEVELAQLRKESHSIESELQEFFYLAAHDLRGPMQKVNLLADLLREDFEDLGDGKLEIMNMLEKVSVESIAMVQNVLQHAEITGLEESIEHMSLSDVCNGIMGTLDPNGAHDCRVVDNSIYGDRVLIQTILRNLIDNAIKHNEGKTLTLQITIEAAMPGYLSLSVADNGLGMNDPSKLFEGHGNDRSKSGFGLLAIRKLIKRRGGHIHAISPPEGSGLVVITVLPGQLDDYATSA